MTRAIDAAFPQYKQLEAGTNRALSTGVPSTLKDFRDAYFLAWKGAKAWAFNGLVAQEDSVVLTQTALIWNQAHSDSSTYVLQPGDLWDPAYAGVANLPHTGNGLLRLNVGPLKTPPKTPPKIVSLRLPGKSTSITATSVPTPVAAKVAAGVAVAAGSGVLVGIGYSLALGKAWDWAFDQAWSEVKSMMRSSGALETRNRKRRR